LTVTAGAAGQSDYTEGSHYYCVQLLSFSEKSLFSTMKYY